MSGDEEVSWRTADPIDPSFEMQASPMYWIARVAGRYELEMEHVLKRVGMDLPRWRVLAILSIHSPASISDLCEHAIVRSSTMTKIIQRMAEAGLVTSAPRPGDGRVTEVRLTASGEEAAQRVREQASRIYRRAFRGMDGAQVQALVANLSSIFRALEEP